jgi:hypothetical protein
VLDPGLGHAVLLCVLLDRSRELLILQEGTLRSKDARRTFRLPEIGSLSSVDRHRH